MTTYYYHYDYDAIDGTGKMFKTKRDAIINHFEDYFCKIDQNCNEEYYDKMKFKYFNRYLKNPTDEDYLDTIYGFF